jgi:hypothetical protein
MMLSFLRFDVSGLNGSEPGQVLLRLYANTGSNTGLLVRLAGDKAWSESDISFQNAPEAKGKSVKSGPYSGGSWITLDVTSLVKGDGSVTLVLLTTDRTQSNFSSRESGSQSPQLIITTGQSAGGSGDRDDSREREKESGKDKDDD